MSRATSRRASSPLAGIELIGALVADQRRAGADRVAERPVEGGGVFGRVGHDLHVRVAGAVEGRPDGADAPVHHVGRRDDVAAGLRLHHGLLGQDGDGVVVEDDAVAQEAVVAVAGIGIEGHVRDDADLRHGRLDGAHRTADEVVRLQGLGAARVARRRVGVREQGDGGDAQPRRPLGLAHGLVDRQALHLRHGGDRLASSRPFDQEQRPDQIIDAEAALAHEAARPLGLAVAPRTLRQGKARRGIVARRRPRRGSDGRGVSASGACGLSPSRSGQKECPFRSTNARCQKRRAVGATRGAALTLAVSGV